MIRMTAVVANGENADHLLMNPVENMIRESLQIRPPDITAVEVMPAVVFPQILKQAQDLRKECVTSPLPCLFIQVSNHLRNLRTRCIVNRDLFHTLRIRSTSSRNCSRLKEESGSASISASRRSIS